MSGRRIDRFSWIFLGAALVLLGLLGAVQFHWTSAIRDAERDKMESLMVSGMERLAHDFNREISLVFLIYQRSFRQYSTNIGQALAQSEAEIQQESSFPGLVKSVFVAELSPGLATPSLFHYQSQEKSLEPTPWPENLASLEQRLALFQDPNRTQSSQEALRTTFFPMAPSIPALIIPEGFAGRSRRYRAPQPWPSRTQESSIRLIVLDLDLVLIQNKMLPELTQQYFIADRHADVDLAVLSATTPYLIYSTNPNRSLETRKSFDAEVPIFHLLYIEGLRSFRRHSRRHPMDSLHGPGRRGGGRQGGPPNSRPGLDEPNASEENSFLAPNEGWRLVAQHRRGSLDRAVDAGHRLHLSIILVVLLLMAGVLYQLLAATRKASRLAAQQLEFITGITHELRTPLAGIRSLGQNLAHGVVQGSDQVKRYGSLIEREESRLSRTIEQVLNFSGILSGQKTLDLESVEVKTVISDALDSVEPLARESRVRIEETTSPEALWVSADRAALRRALENLLTNAIKYGGEDQSVMVESQGVTLGRKEWVDISVLDHGPGIPREEREHLFKPFYRSPQVRDAQHPGSGLGLSLVRRILEAHGGEVLLESQEDEGSTFTLRIPRVTS